MCRDSQASKYGIIKIGQRFSSFQLLTEAGATSCVHAVKLNDKICVAKVQKNKDFIPLLLHELEFFKKHQQPHKNIIELIQAYVDLDGKVGLIFPRFKMDLAQFTGLNYAGYEKASWKALSVKIGVEVLSGVEYLHSQGVIHRDLKPDNVFLNYVTKEGQIDISDVKIGDFGVWVSSSDPSFNDQGTDDHYSPDLMKAYIEDKNPPGYKNMPFSFRTDIWAFTIMLLICFSGRNMPFMLDDNNEFKNLVEHGDAIYAGMLEFLKWMDRAEVFAKKFEIDFDVARFLIEIFRGCCDSEGKAKEDYPNASMLIIKLGVFATSSAGVAPANAEEKVEAAPAAAAASSAAGDGGSEESTGSQPKRLRMGMGTVQAMWSEAGTGMGCNRRAAHQGGDSVLTMGIEG